MSVLMIHPMRRDEIDIAVDWAAREGWNPGFHDAEAFHAADPGGYLLGLVDEQPAACISAVRYGLDFGFVGFYIVDPAMRGRGHGLAIWEAGMAMLAGRNVGLDGVPAQQGNYRKSGFTLAWRNIRFEGSWPAAASQHGMAIRDASALPFNALAAFDRRFFPAPREAFLRLWISLPGHRAKVALHDGTIIGLGVARPCRRGTKIGPLYAEDAKTALALIGALNTAPMPGPMILDVPQSNASAVTLAESLGLVPAFETARMYTAGTPAIDIDRLYGITTFELG